MAHMNIFDSNAFSMLSMLQAIDRVDTLPTRLQTLGLTEVQPIRTTAVTVEKRTQDGYGLIQTTPRAAPLKRAGGDGRELKTFQTVRLGEYDMMYAHEIQNVRAFGTESELMQMQREIARKLQRIDDDLTLTEEHHLLGMIQGVVLDADGSELHNWFDEFDVAAPTPVSFDFSVTDSAGLAALRQKCRDIRRRMKRNSKGSMYRSVHAMCDDQFFDGLTTCPAVQDIYKNQAEAAQLRGQIEDTFTFGGITFENYMGTDDNSTVAIPANTARFFPVGGRGVFVEARAPGESFAVVNRPGRRRYSQIIRDRDRDEWVRIEDKTYPLFIAQHPALLESGTAA